MAESFDPYYTWLGIPPEEQPADHYRLLGVRRFEANEEVIINASDQRMSYIRTFQTGKRSKESQALLNELSAAQVCLLNPEKKKAYDERLKRSAEPSSPVPAAARPPAAAKPAPAAPTARSLPVASPLRPSATPSQPLNMPRSASQARHPQTGLQPLAQIDLDPLQSVSLSASPLRPVVAPTSAPILSPAQWGLVGSAAAALVALLGIVVWASTRPGPTSVARVPAVESNGRVTTPVSSPPARPAPGARPTSFPATVSLPGAGSNSAAPPTPNPPAADSPSTGNSPSSTSTNPAIAPYRPFPLSSGPAPSKLPSITQWTTNERKLIPVVVKIRVAGAPHHEISLSPDGEYLAVLSKNGVGDCKIVNLKSDKGLGYAQSDVEKVVFSAEGQVGLVGSDRALFYGRFASGEPSLKASVGSLSTFRAAVTSGDGRLFVAAMREGPPLLAYDLRTNAPVDSIRTTLAEVSWVGIHDDWLVCWSPEKKGEAIWLRNPDVRHGFEEGLNYAPLGLLQNGQNPTVLAPSRVTAERIHLHYWNLQTGQRYLEYQIEGTSGLSDILAISNDGRIGVIRHDGAITVANLMARQELTRIDFPSDYSPRQKLISAAIMAENGLLAFQGPADVVWVVDVEQLLAKPRWQFVLRDGQHELAGAEAVASNVPPMAPPPAPDLNEAGIADAHAALKAAGVSLSDNPQQVYSIQTRNSKAAGEHARHIAAFADLQHLDLSDTPAAPAILKELPILPKVGSLRLGGTPVSDEDLVHLKKFPGIAMLDLQRTRVTGPGLEHLKHTPNITFLDLPYEGLTREALPWICQLKSVEIVQPFPPGLTDDDLRLVGELKKLKHLSLGQSKIQGPGLAHLKDLQSLEGLDLPPTFPPQQLGHLVTLNFKSVHFPAGSGDPELVHFAGMQRLERVNAPEQMTDEGMKILGTYPALKYVYLASCDRITDAGMAHLAGAQSLREITFPRHLTDQGILPLAMLPNLEYVHLDRTSAITSSGLAPLTGKPSLKRLFIGAIADKTCLDQLKKMPGLEVLGVWYDGPASAEFIRGLKEIKTIKEINFARVTFDKQSLEALQQLTMLETLLIQHFKLDQDQRDALQKALPKCRLVN